MRLLVLLLSLLMIPAVAASAQEAPLRLAVVGLVHGHINDRDVGLPGSLARDDVEVVGIYEANEDLREQIAERYDLDPSLLHSDLEEMLDRTRPEAVTVFTSTFDHRDVVAACAPRGIHVMVEKPLAVTAGHARHIQGMAERHGVHVLTNYVTTWYPSDVAVYETLVTRRAGGPIRKMVAHDGHEGPEEIGVGPYFLEWLTDPVLNGAGALYDFGCYGANLMTWLMGGERPEAVTAVVQQLKDDPVYARVDDEATVVLAYPEAQGIIQASWNWPFNVKDLEVYADSAYAHALDPERVAQRLPEGAEEVFEAAPIPPPNDNPLTYLAAVVRGDVVPDGLSSLRNNVVVSEILDAARRSAYLSETIALDSLDDDDFVSLFDGETLDGWHRHEGLPGDNVGGKWTVEDGVIVGDQDAEGHGGFLVTDDTYRDFVLRFETKLDYTVDSGIFLRVGPEGKSHQVTLDYDQGGQFGRIYLPWTQGAVFDNERGIDFYEDGEWNEVEVRIEGEPARIQFWLNGHLLTDFQHTEETTAGVPEEGTIGLQVHPGGDWEKGKTVKFRNIRVKRL